MACYQNRWWGSVVAFLGLVIVKAMPQVDSVSWATLLFWGFCTAGATLIAKVQPPQPLATKAGAGYLTTGAIAGMLVGALSLASGFIIGTVIGAFCGEMAFSRTPAGRCLQFPSRVFTAHLCNKGLPIVITIAVIGHILTDIYTALYLTSNIQ